MRSELDGVFSSLRNTSFRFDVENQSTNQTTSVGQFGIAGIAYQVRAGAGFESESIFRGILRGCLDPGWYLFLFQVCTELTICFGVAWLIGYATMRQRP